jgi:hypothetical protein
MPEPAPSMSITAPQHGAAPVHFPYELAATAIDELQRAGRVLDEKIGARSGLAVTARVDWRGPHAEEFDTVLYGQASVAGGVAEACRSAAGAIQSAWETANAEQSRLNRLAEEGSTVSRSHMSI